MNWLYFTVTEDDGSVRLIVRRDGPEIQLLTRERWVDRPQLLTRFHDAGFFEEVAFEGAQAAAREDGLSWPTLVVGEPL